MSERGSAPHDSRSHPTSAGGPAVNPDDAASAWEVGLLRGRLRVIGPDGNPYEHTSPETRSLSRLGEEGFWRFHLATGDLDVTPSLHRLLATPAHDATIQPDWTFLVHPDDLVVVRAQIETMVASPGTDVRFECRVRSGDGSYRWLRVRAAAEFDGEACVSYAGSALDTTDRHRSEEIFEQMVRQHAIILNAAGEGICCVDRRGRTTFVNPAAAALLGGSVADLIGRPFCRHVGTCGYDGTANSVHTPDCPVTGPHMREAANIRRDERLRRGDDTTFEGELVVSPLQAGGHEQGAVIVFNDVTEKKAHERSVKDTREKMAQAEKLAALGTLVSGVGHELRTPMSYINNHLYLIQKAAERMVAEEPDMREIADEFVRRCDSSMKGITRMSALLDDLRETYKPDDAEFRMLDVRHVVDKAAHLFRGAYEGPVQLELNLEDVGEMPIQSGRLQQVVINLLNNAAEAMPEGGTINLHAWRKGANVLVEVRDDGPGMTHEVQRSIFNPFYTTKKAGSGLGLYLVKQIIDRHMGRIECESELGRGTTFRIELSPDAGRPARRGRTVAEIEQQLRENENGGASAQDATALASTPTPSTSSSTSSPGSR